MNYLKLLVNNYKNWKNFRKLVKDPKQTHFPSQVYYKYPPMFPFKGKKVLNLGSGTCTQYPENVTNLDAFDGPNVQVVHDLGKTPLPFASNTFDLIIANHVMEHIPNWFECFKECARILKPDGIIEVWVPPVTSDSSFTYRDHINRIGIESFYGIHDLRRPGTNLTASKELTENDPLKRLRIHSLSHRMIITWWTMLAPESLAHWMARHLNNVVTEDCYKFIKI